MKWNCSKCEREIVSEKKEIFCLECGWKDSVEKTEINPETIRSFMEKHYFTYFKFGKDDSDGPVINIGVRITNKVNVLTFAPHDEKFSIDYYPKEQNHYWEAEYSEYSAFLEKLFYFAEKEKNIL